MAVAPRPAVAVGRRSAGAACRAASVPGTSLCSRAGIGCAVCARTPPAAAGAPPALSPSGAGACARSRAAARGSCPRSAAVLGSSLRP
eukprot:11212514-Alexandrium_andersonii.AAC.1